MANVTLMIALGIASVRHSAITWCEGMAHADVHPSEDSLHPSLLWTSDGQTTPETGIQLGAVIAVLSGGLPAHRRLTTG